MTKFRPCIDLHSGQVKQIVGGTLTTTSTDLKTNYVSKLPAGHFAQLYRDNDLEGAHVIMLGPGNEDAAKEALAVWKGGLQVGGGINNENAKQWIEWGADKVIITSFLFPSGKFSQEHLDLVLSALGGDKEKLVIDLSCRRKGDTWFVAMNKWQTITDMEVNEASIKSLEEYCSEFLIHAADNEGLQKGVDEKLVEKLAEWCSIPVTYAGGGRSLQDLDHVKSLSGTRVDLTIGSALDIFGGSGVTFDDSLNSRYPFKPFTFIVSLLPMTSLPPIKCKYLTMGLPIGHHVSRQVALSQPVNSLVSFAILDPSPRSPNEKQQACSISKAIYTIAIQARVQKRDWRQRLTRSFRNSNSLPMNANSNAKHGLKSVSSLSAKTFSGWEVAWHLSISEHTLTQIRTTVHNARVAIGRELMKGPISRKKSRKKSKLGSVWLADHDKNFTAATVSLQVELEKLLRQMIVIAQANGELGMRLEKPALEKNIIVGQILGERLATREHLHGPILAIGYSIRNRYLENSAYKTRNKEKILGGNQAAHDGNALADALLYHPSTPNHRTDVATYANIYGLPPHTVWNLRDCKPFLRMVTWYGSVRRWQPYHFASTPFAKAWPADFFVKCSKSQIEVLKADLAKKNMDVLIKLLEKNNFNLKTIDHLNHRNLSESHCYDTSLLQSAQLLLSQVQSVIAIAMSPPVQSANSGGSTGNPSTARPVTPTKTRSYKSPKLSPRVPTSPIRYYVDAVQTTGVPCPSLIITMGHRESTYFEDNCSADPEAEVAKYTEKLELLKKQSNITHLVRDIENLDTQIKETQKEFEPANAEVEFLRNALQEAIATHEAKTTLIGELKASSNVLNGAHDIETAAGMLEARKARAKVAKLEAEAMESEIDVIEAQMLVDAAKSAMDTKFAGFKADQVILGEKSAYVAELKDDFEKCNIAWIEKYQREESTSATGAGGNAQNVLGSVEHVSQENTALQTKVAELSGEKDTAIEQIRVLSEQLRALNAAEAKNQAQAQELAILNTYVNQTKKDAEANSNAKIKVLEADAAAKLKVIEANAVAKIKSLEEKIEIMKPIYRLGRSVRYRNNYSALRTKYPGQDVGLNLDKYEDGYRAYFAGNALADSIMYQHGFDDEDPSGRNFSNFEALHSGVPASKVWELRNDFKILANVLDMASNMKVFTPKEDKTDEECGTTEFKELYEKVLHRILPSYRTLAITSDEQFQKFPDLVEALAGMNRIAGYTADKNYRERRKGIEDSWEQPWEDCWLEFDDVLYEANRMGMF
ncbi:hypothetical protein VTL71DRAFT_8644 [Oculimacula yallundae]|uniref:1-(5-phosphoribosyl)-5-[(5-phosphoribosylamino)methylideneamino] imidazole-4-carboxamide isomerase n=1 Tax=Oculimacula yallundae TaxID=86028 RepID=A0ABR4CYA4_9HELO